MFQAVIKKRRLLASLPEDQNPGIQGSLAVPVVRQLAEPSPAGSPGFQDFGLRGSCTSSRLDRGLKVKFPKQAKGFQTFQKRQKLDISTHAHPAGASLTGN